MLANKPHNKAEALHNVEQFLQSITSDTLRSYHVEWQIITKHHIRYLKHQSALTKKHCTESPSLQNNTDNPPCKTINQLKHHLLMMYSTRGGVSCQYSSWLHLMYLTPPLVLYFPYITCSGALTNT